METDSEGRLVAGRGVYRPCFLMVYLAMTQVVQIQCTSQHHDEVLANKDTSARLPLFSLHWNVQRPHSSAPSKSSWHTHLREHRCIPRGIIVHLEGENLELLSLLGLSSICYQILDRSFKDAGSLMSLPHRIRAQWLAPWSMVGWHNQWHYWYFPSYN